MEKAKQIHLNIIDLLNFAETKEWSQEQLIEVIELLNFQFQNQSLDLSNLDITSKK